MAPDLEARIMEIIREVIGTETAPIEPDSALAQDLGFDSLDICELVVAVEDEFSINVNDDKDVPRLILVKDVATIVREQLDARAA